MSSVSRSSGKRVVIRRERCVLTDNAREQGLQIRWDVPGDGSCWFHSVLDQCDELGLHIPDVEPGHHFTLPRQRQRMRAMQLRNAVLDFFWNAGERFSCLILLYDDRPTIVRNGYKTFAYHMLKTDLLPL